MWVRRKRWAPPQLRLPPNTDHSSPLHPPNLQPSDALAVKEGVAEENADSSTIAAGNPRIYCILKTETSADRSSISSSLSHDKEGGHWLEEDKIFPLKKRRVLLNLEDQQSNTETVLQGEVIKNVWNARTGKRCTIKTWADHKDDDHERIVKVVMTSPAAKESERGENKIWGDHLINKDDDFEWFAAALMDGSPAAKDIKLAENSIKNISTTRCSRSNGRGWRCSQQIFAGYPLCEHHWIVSNNRRQKKKKKKSNIPHKVASLDLNITPGNANRILQKELLKIGNSRTSRKWSSDHVLNKDANFEWISEVMDNSPPAKKIRMAANTSNNSIITRCTRSNGRGWRCSLPSFGNYSVCEHHRAASKNTRRKEKKKNKNSIPRKLAESRL